MYKYLIFDLDWTLIKSNKLNTKQALHYIRKIDEIYLDKAEYIFSTTQWMNLYDQLKLIFDDKNLPDEVIEKIWKKIYKRIRSKENEVEFFKWVADKIKELSEKYKLFLTTWNSTKFAKEVLDSEWIKDNFELIYGSDEIKKWNQHLNIFKNYSEDNEFYKKSIYFWDWDMDKLFANEAWIKFVRIWDFEEEWNDVIESIKYIDKILSN